MNEVSRVGDVEIAQDLRHERREYRVRLVATVVFALIIVAGLLGLLGRSGPLSDSTATDGSALQVDYERFLRVSTPTELEVRIGSGSGKTEIAIAHDFLEGFRVEGYSTEPDATRVEPDRLVYAFDQEAPSQVTFVIEPQEIGRQTATLYGPGGSELSFDQWVWP